MSSVRSEHKSLLGTHAALAATVIMWGLNVTAVRLLAQSMDAILVATLRTVVAALGLWALMRLSGTAFPRWRGGDLALGCVGGLLMVYANQMLFSIGMRHTTASNAALIMALGPFVSAMLEAAVFGKWLGRRHLSGITLALAGVGAVVYFGPQASALNSIGVGDALVLATVTAFAAGGLAVQRLVRTTEALAVTWFVHMAGAALLLLHASVLDYQSVLAIPSIDAASWGLILFSGLVAMAAGAVAWSRGIAILGVGRTASYLSWVPICGVLFAALLLGEPLSWWHPVGLAAVIAGTVLAMRGRGR